MDFKKFASDASTMFSRAKQYTEEKLGQAEKTEYDAQFESLLLRAERTQYWTEKFINQTETVLIPDPATRVEARLMDKLEHKKREKPTPIEILGQDMIDAANQLGPGTSYGGALIKVGETERMIGMAERDLMDVASTSYLHPLKAFLDSDMKAYAKERKVLENARLDLDFCKSRVKKITKQANKEPTPEEEKAEFELRQAQAEFDRQVEVMRLLLEGITATHAQHQRCLQDFVAQQTAHYARCHKYLVDLQSHLTGPASVVDSMVHMVQGLTTSEHELPSIGGNVSSVGEGGITKVTRTGGGGFSLLCAANSLSMDGDSVPYTVADNGPSDALQTRALHDYHAGDMRERSLAANEQELVVFKLSDDSSAAMFVAQRGAQQGTVPKNRVQLLS